VGQSRQFVSYSGSNRKATLDRSIWPVVNADSQYHITTDLCTSCEGNASQFLPLILDSSTLDMEWTGESGYVKSFSDNHYDTQIFSTAIDDSHIVGMTTLKDDIVLESSTVINVTSVRDAGIRVGSFIVINAEILVVTSIFMDQAIIVLREQQGSTIRATLAVELSVTKSDISFIGGALSLKTAGISAGCLLKIDSEIVLVDQVQGEVVTITRSQQSTSAATHASGATVYNLHKGGVAVNVYEDKCSSGKNAGSNPCAAPIRIDSSWGATNLTATVFDTGGSITSLEVWDASFITVGHYLKVHSEVILVTHVTGNTIHVLRQQKGSTYWTKCAGTIGIVVVSVATETIN